MINLKKFSLSCVFVFSLVANIFAMEAPDFTLKNLYGSSVTLSDYKNKKAVLLLFWNTRCPYCITQIRELSKTHTQLKDKGIELLAINTGESKERINKFLRNAEITLPQVLLDEEYDASEKYDIIGIPAYFLIDKKSEVRFNEHYYPSDDFLEEVSKE